MPNQNANLNNPAGSPSTHGSAGSLIRILTVILVIYLAGVVFGYIPKDNRLGVNEFLLLLFLVLGAIGFWGKITEIDFGEGKVSIKLQKVEERQETTERMVDAVRTALEGVVTKYERQHLEKLLRPNDDIVQYGPHFFGELERLDAIGYVVPLKAPGMVAIQHDHGRDGERFHLREYVELADKGMKYLSVVSGVNQGALTEHTNGDTT